MENSKSPKLESGDSTTENSNIKDLHQRFNQLSLQTNIHRAPTNWLRGGIDNYVTQSCHWDINEAPEMSALKMASRYDANVYKTTDVISDSRNIKKLLSMEHSDSEISMAIHRIGRSLLIDEFPVSHGSVGGGGSRNTNSTRKKRNRTAAANSHINFMSKFLYHTMLENSYLTFSSPSQDVVLRRRSSSAPDMIVGMGDPVSRLHINLPESSDMDYNRTVFWNFKDIGMLLGNNMPIFGGGEYPAISLKLRDMREPINILTGIDCWLDNLICNVPELAMCWHLDGFVQGYDLYKTEEIPDLQDCKFSPVVIKNLASNILKFLQTNAVKEGNTYWLYKAKGDDIVKLYDLSSLCQNNNEANPFSGSVAMLCFKVAQKLYEQGKSKDRSTIFTLLKNCLNLITPTINPQMVATCHFIISEMFLPSSFEVSKDDRIRYASLPLYECRFEATKNVCECTKDNLLDPNWEPDDVRHCWVDLASDVKKQKKQAMKHIVSALEIVKNSQDPWAVKLQKVLVFKASQIFLHDAQNTKDNTALIRSVMSLICLDAYNSLLYSNEVLYEHGYGYGILRAIVHSHVSDLILRDLVHTSSHFNSICTRASFIEMISNKSSSFAPHYDVIFEWCFDIIPELCFSKRIIQTKFDTKEDKLLLCLDLYLEADQFNDTIAVKKLGFVYNELGSYNLSLINLPDNIEEDVVKKLLKQSFNHYQSAISYFKRCSDTHNIALIYSNLGKVMRISGQLQAKFHYGSSDRGVLLYEEQKFYEEAIGFYNQGLDVLRKPSVQKDIWCTISNELSGVYVSIATIMQDHAPATAERSEIARDVMNYLHKALRISEGLVREGFEIARTRTGGIHHKLASLYHNQLRDHDKPLSGKRYKRLYDQAATQYTNAMSYYRDPSYEIQYIQVTMEYIGLLQYLSSAPHLSLPLCLHHLLVLPPYLQGVSGPSAKLYDILKEQILSLLRTMVMTNTREFEGGKAGSLSSTTTSTTVKLNITTESLKTAYSVALRGFQEYEKVPEKRDKILEVLAGLRGALVVD